MPSGALASFPQLAAPLYSHRFIVDGTPTVGDVNFGGAWHTVLVGGLRGGGAGYYALDITSPAASGEGGVAAKVLWEFPNASTPAPVRNNLGLSFGKPVIVETTAAGWVVLVTSGYNNTAGDGRGHLYVLSIADGSVIADLATTAGSAATPSGLAHVSAFTDNSRASAVAKYAYGGDLLGNLWKFDLSGASAASWSVSQFAVVRDGTGNPQPIAAAPELGNIDGKPLVSVGTGKLLGDSDVTNMSVQSIYTMLDNGTALGDVRGGSLVRRTAVVGANQNRTITGDPIDWSSKRGWYLDLPGLGERANTDPSIAFGALVFTTNEPSPLECSSKNFIYALDETQGVQQPDRNFDTVTGLPWAGLYLGNTMASRPVLIALPSGQGRCARASGRQHRGLGQAADRRQRHGGTQAVLAGNPALTKLRGEADAVRCAGSGTTAPPIPTARAPGGSGVRHRGACTRGARAAGHPCRGRGPVCSVTSMHADEHEGRADQLYPVHRFAEDQRAQPDREHRAE